MTPARWLPLLLVLLGLAWASRAEAHAIGLSRGDYSLDDGRLSVALTFARGDALALAPALDADGDGALSEAELARGGETLRRDVLDRLSVRAAAERCSAQLSGARLTEGDGLVVRASYDCAGPVRDVNLSLDGLLDELGAGHRHVAHLVATDREQVLFHGSSECTIGRAAPVPASPGESGRRGLTVSIFRMGVEHILTGYDHLLFLLGLVLVARRMRSLLPVVTAFTVAHSLTLGVAALGWWTPPSRVVEPLIALSIAYVGLENLFMKDTGKRWRVTFPFGLVHGFGFASALRELSLPHHDVPLALVSFNLGVEVGQLGVILLMLPLVSALRRLPWLEGGRARIPSLGVAAIGAVWFVVRVV